MAKCIVAGNLSSSGMFPINRSLIEFAEKGLGCRCRLETSIPINPYIIPSVHFTFHVLFHLNLYFWG